MELCVCGNSRDECMSGRGREREREQVRERKLCACACVCESIGIRRLPQCIPICRHTVLFQWPFFFSLHSSTISTIAVACIGMRCSLKLSTLIHTIFSRRVNKRAYRVSDVAASEAWKRLMAIIHAGNICYCIFENNNNDNRIVSSWISGNHESVWQAIGERLTVRLMSEKKMETTSNSKVIWMSRDVEDTTWNNRMP